MKTIENKLDGVRLKPIDLGGDHAFNIVLEALREVNEQKQPSLTAYANKLHEEFAQKYNLSIRNKLALLYAARTVIERTPGIVKFNPKDEGLYLTDTNAFSWYFKHIHGD